MRKWPTPTAATGPTCNEGTSGDAAQSAAMFIRSTFPFSRSLNTRQERSSSCVVREDDMPFSEWHVLYKRQEVPVAPPSYL